MLTTTSGYALRAVTTLARFAGERPLLARELARIAAVPGHYISKVLRTLTRNGVLSAARGARGGYRLARPAASIHLIDVVGPFEVLSPDAACLFGDGRVCSDEQACAAHAAWKEVRSAFVTFLRNTTIADIGGIPDPLAALPRSGEAAVPLAAAQGQGHTPAASAAVRSSPAQVRAPPSGDAAPGDVSPPSRVAAKGTRTRTASRQRAGSGTRKRPGKRRS